MKQEIRDNLNDICLELTDQNINALIKYTAHGSIKIFNRPDYYLEYKSMRYKDVEDVLDRLKLYMDDNGYSTKIELTYDYPNLRYAYIKRIVNRYKGIVYSINVKFLNREIDKYLDEIINLKSWLVPDKGFSGVSKAKMYLKR